MEDTDADHSATLIRPPDSDKTILPDTTSNTNKSTEIALRNEYNKFCNSLDQSKLRLSNEDRSCDSLIDQSKLSGEEEDLNIDPMASFSKRETGDGQESTDEYNDNGQSGSRQDQVNNAGYQEDEGRQEYRRVQIEDQQQEWSPGTDPDLQEPWEGGDTLTEEEEEEEYNYTDYIDSETDYENDHIIQYQAAIEAGLVDDERQCWVCFASDEDDPRAVWVHPCRCSGTTKWVHHVCLQRWVDEKQKGYNTTNVSCPQCGTEYIIRFPPAGLIMKILDEMDSMIGRTSPLIAGGILAGATFWSFVTYGAVTVMQVAGHDEGYRLMEAADPLILLVSLPIIPIGLFLGKMVRWQDRVLKVLRVYLPQFPLTRYILPAFAEEPELEGSGAQASLPPPADTSSTARNFCGALVFPTIATFLGGALYPDTSSPLRRAALGGITFILVKGVLKIYHKQHQYIRQSRRKIDNFDINTNIHME